MRKFTLEPAVLRGVSLVDGGEAGRQPADLLAKGVDPRPVSRSR